LHRWQGLGSHLARNLGHLGSLLMGDGKRSQVLAYSWDLRLQVVQFGMEGSNVRTSRCNPLGEQPLVHRQSAL
jgi:hypothetical protein